MKLYILKTADPGSQMAGRTAPPDQMEHVHGNMHVKLAPSVELRGDVTASERIFVRRGDAVRDAQNQSPREEKPFSIKAIALPW